MMSYSSQHLLADAPSVKVYCMHNVGQDTQSCRDPIAVTPMLLQVTMLS